MELEVGEVDVSSGDECNESSSDDEYDYVIETKVTVIVSGHPTS